jgi:hypothetical protein
MCRQFDSGPRHRVGFLVRPTEGTRSGGGLYLREMRVIACALLSALLFACGGTARTDAGREVGTASSSPISLLCGPERSSRDAAGLLIGSTSDSTTIRIAAPAEVRAEAESTFQWRMTGNEALNAYAEQPGGPVGAWGRLPRVDPNAIQSLGGDAWTVRLTFPSAGCWRLHSERAGGKLAGDVWIDVLPR